LTLAILFFHKYGDNKAVTIAFSLFLPEATENPAARIVITVTVLFLCLSRLWLQNIAVIPL
jgi:hypothetical protein